MKYDEYEYIKNDIEELPKLILNEKVEYISDTETITIYNNATHFTKNVIENLELDKLKSFNLPLSYITVNDKIVGTKENNINSHDFDITDINTSKLFNNLNQIKEDIMLLSSNNLLLKNISFIYNEDKIIFTNILENIEFSNYDYDTLYNKNIEIINKFLIGLIIYNVYKENKHISEEEKNKINKYNNTYCQDKYFGDVLKNMFSFDDKDINNKKL